MTISPEDQALIEREASAHAHLVSHQTPKAITRVDGCDCGGIEWHRVASPWSSEVGCSIWGLDREQFLSNIDAARLLRRAQPHPECAPMTIEYAVYLDKTDPYFKVPESDQYLKIHNDPAVPYRKQQTFPRGAATLMWRDGGEWSPVNGIDLHCIGMRAKHEIIKKQAIVDGFGWARCTCGWQDEESYKSGYASYDYEASAAEHLAAVEAAVQKFRDLMRYIPRTPEQEACPHERDEASKNVNNPGLRDWHCKDCGLRMQYVADFESWVR